MNVSGYRVASVLVFCACLCIAAPAAGPPVTATSGRVSVGYDAQSSTASVVFKDGAGGSFTVSAIRPLYKDPARHVTKCTVSSGGDSLALKYQAGPYAATLRLTVSADGCRITLADVTGEVPHVAGVLRGPDELLPCRVAMDKGKLAQEVRDDIFEIGYGRASNRRMNTVYSRGSFLGVYISAAGGASADIKPLPDAYSFRTSAPVSLDLVDLWQVIGMRRGVGLVPRDWLKGHRPFPWAELSPVQLPYICMTDPRQWELSKKQIDFLADNLRDYGFLCYGEWPVTQYYPEYDPKLQPTWLEFQRSICEYAHKRGIKILRWVTDPEIDTEKYPDLNKMMTDKGWFAPNSSLLDYSNPSVQDWITGEYSKLARTGPDFYWVDNCGPTPTVYDPKMTELEGFRRFYASIQKGLLSTGRNDILIRSGASYMADYSAAGILDVYAPGPDVANCWVEQAISVATQLVHEDYLCHYNLWRRAIDDYFPAGPQTVDQTRAMATLLAFTGLGFTTTDVGLPSIPKDRLELLRQLVPIGSMRPLDIYRFDVKGIDALQGWGTQAPDGYKFDENPLPRIWTLNVLKGDYEWQLLAVFNWGMRTEQQHFISFADLGLDPDHEYLVFDFFSQKPVGVFSGGIGCRVAPSSARSLSIHPIGDRPFLVSTDRHITQGVVDTDHLAWDGKQSTLSGVFTAGVKGRTYHLTFYARAGARPVYAKVGGHRTGLQQLGGGLFRVAVACTGKNMPWSVGFGTSTVAGHAAQSVLRAGSAHAVSSVSDIAGRRGSVALADLRNPRTRSALLSDSRKLLDSVVAGGVQLVVVAPDAVTPDVMDFQSVLGVKWGIVRSVDGSSRALTVGTAEPKAVPGTLFQTTCISYATNRVDAVYRPLSRGGVLVVSPGASQSELNKWLGSLAANPQAWVKNLKDVQAHRAESSFTVITKWSFYANIAEATINFSPCLRRLELSTYTAREGIAGDPVPIPMFDVTFNKNLTLLPLLDPCDPQSPPDNYDLMYRRLPAEAVWWGENGDNNEMRYRFYAPAQCGGLGKTMPRNLTLCISTPGEIGWSDLLPLPSVVVVD